MESPAEGSLHTPNALTNSPAYVLSLSSTLTAESGNNRFSRFKVSKTQPEKRAFVILYSNLKFCLALFPILSVPLFILHLLPLSYFLSLSISSWPGFCYVGRAPIYAQDLCSYCCRSTHVAKTVCCLLSVCVSSCTYAGSVRANSLSASHKIKQYPSLIWHFGATLMRFVTAATSSWPLPHFGSLAGWHL